MTVYLPFQPSSSIAPSFYVTINGAQYSVTVKWNVSAQRYYFDLYDQSGTWIVTLPLLDSTASRQIAAFAYDPDLRAMQVTIDPPFWRPAGQMEDITLENVDPPSLNGTVRAQVIDDANRTFPLAQDPGQIVTLGSVNRYMNLIAGYIPGWRMIFRNSAFEVSQDG
jgi:Domain of unknown function (DUF6983)